MLDIGGPADGRLLHAPSVAGHCHCGGTGDRFCAIYRHAFQEIMDPDLLGIRRSPTRSEALRRDRTPTVIADPAIPDAGGVLGDDWVVHVERGPLEHQATMLTVRWSFKFKHAQYPGQTDGRSRRIAAKWAPLFVQRALGPRSRIAIAVWYGSCRVRFCRSASPARAAVQLGGA
jgi:hypothetical protein